MTRSANTKSLSFRSLAAHYDEFVYSAQVTLPQESDQLRLHCHSATSPLGWNATRLERHQGHCTRSPVAHFDKLIYYAQATLPQESDQLRLHCHSATSPLGWNATRLERHQGHSARSPVAHFDELIYSAQVTLPQESDQLKLHYHSATLPLGYIATRLERHRGHCAQSPVAHFDELIYSAQATLPQESDQLRLHCHSAGMPPRPLRPEPSSSL